MTNDQRDDGADADQTLSLVRLDGEQWIATNVDDPTITHHATALTDLLFAHRHAVAFQLGKTLVVRYTISDPATADRIDRIRTAGAEIARLRRAANQAERRISDERRTLMRHLAALHVTPAEIAQIIGVPPTAVPKDLGTDQDAHLARALFADADSAPPPDQLF